MKASELEIGTVVGDYRVADLERLEGPMEQYHEYGPIDPATSLPATISMGQRPIFEIVLVKWEYVPPMPGTGVRIYLDRMDTWHREDDEVTL